MYERVQGRWGRTRFPAGDLVSLLRLRLPGSHLTPVPAGVSPFPNAPYRMGFSKSLHGFKSIFILRDRRLSYKSFPLKSSFENIHVVWWLGNGETPVGMDWLTRPHRTKSEEACRHPHRKASRFPATINTYKSIETVYSTIFKEENR